MEVISSKLLSEIGNLAKLGSEMVKNKRLHKALRIFDQAYTLSKRANHEKTELTCAFNLGAVYIALGVAEKGLELLRSVEELGSNNESSNGDLYFNFGLAYERLSNFEEAVRYYDLCVKCFQQENDNSMYADACVKLGYCYSQMKNHRQAVYYYGLAASGYETTGNLQKEVFCKCEQATSLFADSQHDKALQLAEECLEKCSQITCDNFLEFMYNDLGLIFTQCKQYGKAEMCFEHGLPAVRRPNGDQKQEAVLLQNLGAIYNCQGDYQRAISIHEEALAKYAALRNRLCQGQCFSNLAYAYCQIGLLDKAFLSFHHALQAAKDTGDLHSQWQVLEGLACLSSNQGKIEESISLFKQCLSALSQAGEKTSKAQDRIVAKLSKVLEFQIKGTLLGERTLTQTLQPDQMLTASVRDKQVNGLANINMIPVTRSNRENKVTLSQREEDNRKAVPADIDRDVQEYAEQLRRNEMEDISEEESSSEEGSEEGSSEEGSSEEGSEEGSEESSEESSEEESEEESEEGNLNGREEGRTHISDEGRAHISEEGRAHISEEGRAQGREEGRAQGREEGRAHISEEGRNERLIQYGTEDKIGKDPKKQLNEEFKKRVIETNSEGKEDDLKPSKFSNLLSSSHHSGTMAKQSSKEENQSSLSTESPTGRMMMAIDTNRSFRIRTTIEESESEYDDIEEEESDWESSEEEQDRSPPLPVQYPPHTLHNTYETPVTSQLSPPYAEIDFSKSGRPIQRDDSGEIISANKRPDPSVLKPSNYFYPDDEEDGSSTKKTIYGEDEDTLYESIRPRTLSKEVLDESQMSALPRAERERIMYEEHKKTRAAERKAEEESTSGKSKSCIIM